MRSILFWSVFVGLSHADCVSVPGNRIAAGDLRDAVPFLQAVDPAASIGFAPLPGAQRILSPRELRKFVQRQGIISSAEPLSSVCVERAARAISPDEMKEALFAALGIREAELDLIEFSRQAVPAGKLEFQRSGLNQPPRQAPDTPVIWRGRLIYDGRSSMMVWAKVKISVQRPVLTASDDVAIGAVIGADQIKEFPQKQFPFRDLAPLTRDEIVGKIARRRIAAGQEFVAGALEESKDISRGDKVRVSIVEGAATLSLDVVAQSSGKKGQSILVRNPATGKNFHAVVDEKGRATVRSSPGA